MADNDLKIWQNHLLLNTFHTVDAKFDLVLRPMSHGNPAMPFTTDAVPIVGIKYWMSVLRHYRVYTGLYQRTVLTICSIAVHGKHLSLKKSSTLCNTRGYVRNPTKYYEPPY